MTQTYSYWSPEDIEQAKTLRQSGRTSRQIATAMGKTRNSVIGKLNRLGLSVRREVSLESQKHERHTTPRIRAERKLPELVAPDMSCVVKMDDLRDFHCRFPLGDPRHEDFVFCGQPRQKDYSYCSFHVRVCRGSERRRS